MMLSICENRVLKNFTYSCRNPIWQAASKFSRDFALPERCCLPYQQNFEWETRVIVAPLAYHSWLPLPEGDNHAQIDLAVEIPATYPDAQLDMFYVYPALLANGKVLSDSMPGKYSRQ
ncbi:E2/UBC family protein [Salmonella enterica]|uniref:E2/UBC family protein n=1 Tax=Salmonella enterica TaxID=28901 RepID=UPI000DECDD94|nr:hypothetical protein CHE29_23560 [Salmonella enterica]